MAFGRRRDLDKKHKKNMELIVSIIANVGNKYINENIVNIRNEIYSNDILNMKNQIEYIINMDRKLKFTYKKVILIYIIIWLVVYIFMIIKLEKVMI